MRDSVSPLVSIIVPIYNMERCVAQCVASLTGQHYPHLEFILVDDGSTDATPGLCDQLAAQDSRITVLHVANGGPARARNLGMEVCQGDFILFMDSDDTLEPDALAVLVARQAATDADMVVGDFVKLNQGQRAPSNHDLAFQADTLLNQRDIFIYVHECYLNKPNRYHLFVYIWGRLLRASIIREHQLRFNEALFTCEDVAFNFDYIRHARSLLFLNQVLLNKTVSSYDGSAFVTNHLLHNGLRLFGHQGAFACIRGYLEASVVRYDYAKNLGHAYVVYTIIQLVRICGTDLQRWVIPQPERQAVHALIQTVLTDPQLHHSLPAYHPTAGDSVVLPWLLRWKMVRLIALVCRYKARKRYQRVP